MKCTTISNSKSNPHLVRLQVDVQATGRLRRSEAEHALVLVHLQGWVVLCLGGVGGGGGVNRMEAVNSSKACSHACTPAGGGSGAGISVDQIEGRWEGKQAIQGARGTKRKAERAVDDSGCASEAPPIHKARLIPWQTTLSSPKDRHCSPPPSPTDASECRPAPDCCRSKPHLVVVARRLDLPHVLPHHVQHGFVHGWQHCRGQEEGWWPSSGATQAAAAAALPLTKAAASRWQRRFGRRCRLPDAYVRGDKDARERMPQAIGKRWSLGWGLGGRRWPDVRQ